jgi:energy-coupling factor transport system ATP-binding protein
VLTATGITVTYGSLVAVRDIDLVASAGRVVALMGRNGSGKSSLLWAVQGTGRRRSGAVDVDGRDPGTLSSSEARRLVGLVPQTASDLLHLETVDQECSTADNQADTPGGTYVARSSIDWHRAFRATRILAICPRGSGSHSSCRSC